MGADGRIVGDRVFFAWRWNSPGKNMRPMMLLEIDDLRRGILRWSLSPKQASDLCHFGYHSVREQAQQFGDEQLRDYDVREGPKER